MLSAGGEKQVVNRHPLRAGIAAQALKDIKSSSRKVSCPGILVQLFLLSKPSFPLLSTVRMHFSPI